MDARAESAARLRAVKLVHTAAWALFASAIVAIPLVAFVGQRMAARGLIALVLLECLILAFNDMRCPLTKVAERLTPDRQDNFDIYLPAAIARYNKQIFGTLFVADLILVTALWW